MRFSFLYFPVLLIFILSSCAKDKGKINYGNFPPEIGKVFGNSCAISGCHNESSYQAAGDLNLSSWTSLFNGSSSGSAVIPYSSRFSSLCYYINTYSELGTQNTPVMPLNAPPLSFDKVKLIKDWIDAGAPDVNGNIKWGDDPKRRKLYAVNQGCDVVTVLDAETQLPIRFIEVGTKPGSPDVPHSVRVSPDGEYWYVIFINNNVMQKFRCSDDQLVANIPLMPLAAGTGTANALDWNTFVISNNGKRAYAVSWSANGQIAAVDLENNSFIRNVGMPNPHAIALDAENDQIYVGAQSGNYITRMDTDFTNSFDYSLNEQFPSGISSLDIHDMVLSPNNIDLFITCQKSNDVRVFNTQTSAVTATIAVGFYPQEIVYSKAYNQYFVTCTYDSTLGKGSLGTIARISAGSYAVTKIKCGYQPHGLAADDKKKLLYVLSRNVQSDGPAPHHSAQCAGRNGFVNFIDMSSFTVQKKKFELSVDPYFIYLRP